MKNGAIDDGEMLKVTPWLQYVVLRRPQWRFGI